VKAEAHSLMQDLYLIRRSDESVWVYSPCGQNRWQLSRLSAVQLTKVKHVLCHGPKGWSVQDQSPGKHGGSSCLIVPAGGQGVTPQSGTLADSTPPMGLWRSSDGKCEYTLSDSFPHCPPLELPFVVEEPFITVRFLEASSVSRLEIKFTNKALTDDGMERVFAKLTDMLLNLAKRPETSMYIVCDLRDAAVPGMRHVRRFMAFAHERGDIMDLFIRGNAIILKPSGFVGSALVHIIKMLQKVLQAAWPETIAPNEEEGNKFLAQLSPAAVACKDEGLKVPNVVLGQVREPDVKDTPAAHQPCQVPEPDAKDAQLPHQPDRALGPLLPDVRGAPNTLDKLGPQPLSSTSTGITDAVFDAEKDSDASPVDNNTQDRGETNNARSPMRRQVSRKRSNAVTHPDLMKLEVPVWVAMGHRSNNQVRPACMDSKEHDAESVIEDARDPVLCGCSCKSKEQYSLQPQLQALFTLVG